MKLAETTPVEVILNPTGHSDQRVAMLRTLLDGGWRVRFDPNEAAPGEAAIRVADGQSLDTPGTSGRTVALPLAGGPVTVEAIEGACADLTLNRPTRPRESWKPWFPVIDYDRCTNCMQCLSFCLFDVYGVSDNHQIQVQNQDKCKTDCPACSRVCPEVAILFPKYRNGPINGDVVSEADLQREAMKVDISSLLGGDIYAMLRDRSERSKSRFSKERDEDKALKERQRCLKLLAEGGDIPAEVFSSLPSREEIQQKAEAARSRADAARRAATSTPPGFSPGASPGSTPGVPPGVSPRP